MDHPQPSLKYVAAGDLEGTAKGFDGANVNGSDGEKLGTVEGFIMDVRAGRPRHVVVGAGWFLHKHFLLPIGHATLAGDNSTLVADLTKDRVNRFPGFDKDEFERMDQDGASGLDGAMAAAFDVNNRDGFDHYQVPGWWQSSFYGPSDKAQ